LAFNPKQLETSRYDSGVIKEALNVDELKMKETKTKDGENDSMEKNQTVV